MSSNTGISSRTRYSLITSPLKRKLTHEQIQRLPVLVADLLYQQDEPDRALMVAAVSEGIAETVRWRPSLWRIARTTSRWLTILVLPGLAWNVLKWTWCVLRWIDTTPGDARRARMLRKIETGVCLHCGYDTRGLPGPICPECGQDPKAMN